MKQVFTDPNVELFMRMCGGDKKPAWARHLESVGIEVSPTAYLSEEFIEEMNSK